VEPKNIGGATDPDFLRGHGPVESETKYRI